MAAAVKLIELVGEKPSIRKVADVIAATNRKGRALRWSDIAEALKVLPGNTSGNTPAQVGNDLTSDGQHHGNTPARLRIARGSQRSSKTLPIVQGLSLLPSVGVAAAPPSLPWRSKILDRVTALAPRQIRSLDHREMHDVGSAHILRFMPRKARAEAVVRRLAIGLVGRIRNVVSAKDHPEMADLTVFEYFAYGDEIFAAGGSVEWDSPWQVVGWAQQPSVPR